MELFRTQRGMLEQAFTHVGKVPNRMAGGRHTPSNLIYVHTLPGYVFGCQSPQHDPRSVTSADSPGKACFRIVLVTKDGVAAASIQAGSTLRQGNTAGRSDGKPAWRRQRASAIGMNSKE